MKIKVLTKRLFGIPLAISTIALTLYLSQLWQDTNKNIKLLIEERPDILDPELAPKTSEAVPPPSDQEEDKEDNSDKDTTDLPKKDNSQPVPPEQPSATESKDKPSEDTNQNKDDKDNKDTDQNDLPPLDTDLEVKLTTGKINILEYIKRKVNDTNRYGPYWSHHVDELLTSWKLKNTTTSMLVVLKEFEEMLKKGKQDKPTQEQ